MTDEKVPETKWSIVSKARGNDAPAPGLPPDDEAGAEPYPWLKSYPAGIRWDTEFPVLSLPEMFDEAVAAHGERDLTNFLGATLTYSQVGDQTNRLAAGLQARGIGRGHRVGLFLPNTPYYIAAYFAVLKTGATVVNFNPLYSVEELVEQAQDSSISAMVTLDLAVLFDKVAELAERGMIETVVVCPFADLLPRFKGLLFRVFKRGDIAHAAGSPVAKRCIDWDSLIDNDGQFEPAVINPQEDIALLQYTGGTTGIPKGAMLTHANLTTNVDQMLSWNSDIRIGKERIIGILPFFHVFAMTAVMNLGVRIGATLILMPRFEIGQAVALIRQHRPTILPGVPTLFSALINHSGTSRDDLSSLKICISGGAALAHELRKEFEAFAVCRLVEGYGLSETSPVATCNPFGGIEKKNSIGQPLPATYISIRSLEDPTREMPQGEPGEICIKGPQVMPGYWNRPEETANAFVDGHFRTGDVGYMDEDGFTFIIDRIKDMINASGFKVYPRRIEEAILEHAAVAEVTVIGIPDDYRGEAPKAFIRLKAGSSLTAEDLLAHLEPRLSKLEMPAGIEFRDELPKTMIGKPSKKELREESAT
ncbi:MAG TPA: long-chain fatty acid--CoA ligase [Aestuariivirgaceae bacterium]|nr:long-chain fatty acid--CoA ligase [Aestuariivirgaceae bacterium]